MSRISQQQLESYLWGAATLLRGTIDAGDYKQFIFPLLFHKRLCDVFDEETQAAFKESGGDVEFAQHPDGPWRHARRWSSPRSNGWTGSTGGGSSRPIGHVPPAECEQRYYQAQETPVMVAEVS